jgi:hypothetical protein
MPCSGMLCYMTLVRMEVSEERITSIIGLTRIGELGTSAITSKWSTLWRNTIFHSVLQLLLTANVPSLLILVTMMMEAICSSKTSVLTRATQHNIPEDGIRHSHHREDLKSYNRRITSIWNYHFYFFHKYIFIYILTLSQTIHI